MDYLAWNRAADLLLNISEPTPPYDFNSIWRLFVRPNTQRLFVDWESVGHHILAELHTLSARYPKDRWIEQLIADLKRVSPEYRQWWLKSEAVSTTAHRKALQHPLLGHVEFDFLILQLPSNPDLAIHIYTPLGDSKTKLEKHLAMLH